MPNIPDTYLLEWNGIKEERKKAEERESTEERQFAIHQTLIICFSTVEGRKKGAKKKKKEGKSEEMLMLYIRCLSSKEEQKTKAGKIERKKWKRQINEKKKRMNHSYLKNFFWKYFQTKKNVIFHK